MDEAGAAGWAAGRSSVVAALTPMFGRAQDEEALLALVDDRRNRLVTVTGRGGVGKTRLALEVVRRFEDRGERAVRFIPLAGVSDPALVVPTLASALGVPPLADLEAVESVARRLHHDDVVLVLDNFEHVLAAAPALDHLIERCPSVSILVTSQSPLKRRTEQVLALAPLPVPSDEVAELAALAAQPSIATYCEQAAAVDRGFALDRTNGPAIAALCRRLEGLPLAIELAAARAATLPAAEILRWFDADRLGLLRRPRGDAPERQRDLRAAIAWTVDLLSPDERRLFRRLSVFAGSFDLDAVDALADAASPAEAFDILATLVDLHLVDPVRGAERARFAMASSIRAYAADDLRAAGDDEQARLRHIELRVRDARAASAAFDAADEEGALKALVADHDDAFMATQAALDAGLVAEALDLIAGTAPLWDVRGYHAAHAAVMERALALADEHGVVSVGHADSLLWSALLGLRHAAAAGRDELVERLRRGEAMARALDAEASRIRALEFWMLSAPYTLDFRRAQEAAAEGLRRAAGSPDRHWLGRIQVLAGMLAHQAGDDERACALGHAALLRARRLRDHHTVVLAAMLLGPMAAAHPELAADIPSTEEALDLARATGLVLYEALLLPTLFAELAGKDDGRALRYAVESLTLARSVPGSPIVRYNLVAAVSLAGRRGDSEVAARLYGVLREVLPDLERTMAPEHVRSRNRLLEQARSSLGDARFDEAVRRGSTMTLDDGLEAALVYVQEARARAAPETVVDVRTDALLVEVPEALTERRRDVLRLLAEGLPNKEIATRLGVTPKTVMHHTTTIYRLLGVRGRSEAVAWAIRAGVVE